MVESFPLYQEIDPCNIPTWDTQPTHPGGRCRLLTHWCAFNTAELGKQAMPSCVSCDRRHIGEIQFKSFKTKPLLLAPKFQVNSMSWHDEEGEALEWLHVILFHQSHWLNEVKWSSFWRESYPHVQLAVLGRFLWAIDSVMVKNQSKIYEHNILCKQIL